MLNNNSFLALFVFLTLVLHPTRQKYTVPSRI